MPIPGKGENSWDCDDDAIYTKTYSFEDCSGCIYNAIGKLEMDVMRERRRHASLAWVPEKDKAEERDEEASDEPPSEA